MSSGEIESAARGAGGETHSLILPLPSRTPETVNAWNGERLKRIESMTKKYHPCAS